jgi:hypothetical protein
MYTNNIQIPKRKYNFLILDKTHSRYYLARYIVFKYNIKYTLSRFEIPPLWIRVHTCIMCHVLQITKATKI